MTTPFTPSSPKEVARRFAVMMKAREKWKDRRIALVELDGVFSLQPLTGSWEMDHTVDPPFAREKTKPYWTGKSLAEAEAVVR